ncbi:MAG: putative metallopeptidase [archaeon]
MKYSYDKELTIKAREIAVTLGFEHVVLERIHCLKSNGSKTKRTIARIHGLSKAVQLGLSVKPAYVIEFLSEKFDKLKEDDQIKTIIHELMHVPHSFGGGFRHHKNFVTRNNVEKAFQEYRERKKLQA